MPTGGRPHQQDDQLGEPACRRTGLGERSLGRGGGRIQRVRNDASRRRSSDNGFHVVRRLLHEALPSRSDGETLAAVPQDAPVADPGDAGLRSDLAADRRRAGGHLEQRGSAERPDVDRERHHSHQRRTLAADYRSATAGHQVDQGIASRCHCSRLVLSVILEDFNKQMIVMKQSILRTSANQAISGDCRGLTDWIVSSLAPLYWQLIRPC